MQHLENFPLDLKEVHLFMIQRFVCVELKVHFSISVVHLRLIMCGMHLKLLFATDLFVYL